MTNSIKSKTYTYNVQPTKMIKENQEETDTEFAFELNMVIKQIIHTILTNFYQH